VLDKTTFTARRSIAGSGFNMAGDFASVADNAVAAVSSAYITYSSLILEALAQAKPSSSTPHETAPSTQTKNHL
jgi:hypothetical protein